MKALATLLVLLALAGCGEENGATPSHVAKAVSLCGPDKAYVIINATYAVLYRSCGYRCTEPTGRVKYAAEVRCGGAYSLDARWLE